MTRSSGPRGHRQCDGANLELTYLSRDGEEGYPGNLKIKVVYTLTEKNELKIVYSATTERTRSLI